MIPPKVKPPVRWQPGMLVGEGTHVCVPTYANDHFIVNSTRQVIMRALVSSRMKLKQLKKD